MASINYSQNDEQSVILSNLPQKGRFLDIGANDGITLSNTYALALQGYSGVCLEPSPRIYPKLVELYKDNTLIIPLQVALATYDGTITFYDSDGEGVSSTVEGNVERYGCKSTKCIVECLSSESIFDSIGYDFDFISLDTELTNFELLQVLPFDKLKDLKLICVEHDSKQVEIKEFLKQYGFIEIHRTPENILLKVKE